MNRYAYTHRIAEGREGQVNRIKEYISVDFTSMFAFPASLGKLGGLSTGPFPHGRVQVS